MHIKNIFEEGELDADRTIQDFLIVQKEGNRNISGIGNDVRQFHAPTDGSTFLSPKQNGLYRKLKS